MYLSVPQPRTWVQKSYNNKPYYLVEIDVNDEEYIKIEDYFDDYKIVMVERVQNPYQYGKYLLFKLEKNSPTEHLYFMPLKSPEDLNIALRFNCDYRRLNYTNDPFFATVSAAVAFSSHYNQLVVLQGLKNYTYHDSGRFPKYVVTYESNN